MTGGCLNICGVYVIGCSLGGVEILSLFHVLEIDLYYAISKVYEELKFEVPSRAHWLLSFPGFLIG